MGTPAFPPIEIFAPGTHTPMVGDPISFSASDIADTAAAYDPTVFEAPIVVGHPKHNAPAYGWAKSLSVRGGKLVAEADQIQPAFAAAVREGRYKKVSAQFFPPAHTLNPKPGTWYLRHVGFLGGHAPAITGLKPVEFGAGDADLIEIEVDFAAAKPGLMSQLRDLLASSFGAAETDRVLPVLDLTTPAPTEPVAPAIAAAPPTDTPEPEKPSMTEAEIAALKAENDRLKQEAADRKAAEVAASFAARQAEQATFVGDLVKQGRVLPRERASLSALLANLGEELVSFAAPEGEVKSKPLDIIKPLLKRLPVQVPQGERSAPTDDEVSFAAGGAITADLIGERADKLIADAKAIGRTLSNAEAVQRAKQQLGAVA